MGDEGSPAKEGPARGRARGPPPAAPPSTMPPAPPQGGRLLLGPAQPCSEPRCATSPNNAATP